MTRDQYVLWTCDRCHANQHEAPSAQPTQWTGLIRLDLPLLAVEEATRMHLCKSCSESLHDWWYAP